MNERKSRIKAYNNLISGIVEEEWFSDILFYIAIRVDYMYGRGGSELWETSSDVEALSTSSGVEALSTSSDVEELSTSSDAEA